MSDHHEEPSNPIGNVIGTIFLIAVPGAFIVMLAVTGFAFVQGVKSPSEREIPTVAAAAPAPAPAPQTGGGDEGGGAAPAAATPSEDFLAIGKATFGTCAACHGPDAKGVKAGPVQMAPSLIGGELIMHENPDVPSLIILKGIAKRPEYLQQMLPLGSALDDEKIAASLTYIRTNFGNNGTPISTEQVAAAREKYADINPLAGIPREDIVKIVESKK